MQSIGSVSANPAFSVATSVSGDGMVIVGADRPKSFNSSLPTFAFRWTEDNGMLPLNVSMPDLAGAASAVSEDGTTVVGTTPTSLVTSYAYKWTADEGLVFLTEGPSSVASGVSSDGTVIVGTTFAPGVPRTERGFVWTAETGAMRLDRILSDAGVDYAADGWTSNWTLDGVSDDGKTIIGRGIRDGGVEAFVAVIPEPGVATATLLSAGLLMVRRRRT